MLCDVQVVTGLGILISGFVLLRCGLDAIHSQIAVFLAWFSTVTHLSGLEVLRTHLNTYVWSKHLRFSLMPPSPDPSLSGHRTHWILQPAEQELFLASRMLLRPEVWLLAIQGNLESKRLPGDAAGTYTRIPGYGVLHGLACSRLWYPIYEVAPPVV